MTLMTFELFCAQPFEREGRFLGFDLGARFIGLALSDRQRMIASPFSVMERTKWKQDAESLIKIIQDNHVVGLVIGFPLNMNGTEGPRCQSTRQFVENLSPLANLPICLWDERLSTMAVTRTLLEADVSRAKRQKVVDKMAAAYILQGFLDAFTRAHQR